MAENSLQSKPLWREQIRSDTADYLLRYWSSRLVNQKTRSLSPDSVAETTMIQVCRPGWPGNYIPHAARSSLLTQLIQLARLPLYSPTITAVQEFSEAAAQLIVEIIPEQFADPFGQGNEKIVSEYVKVFLQSGLSENQAFLRAGKIAKKLAAMSGRQTGNVQLKSAFSMPTAYPSKLAKEDIRSVLLRIAQEKRPDRQSGLGKLLQEVFVVSHNEVRSALGEEIYAICQPMGFADQWKRVLIAKVSSSAAAHKAAYYSTEIIRRLKPLPGFASITTVRYQQFKEAAQHQVQE